MLFRYLLVELTSVQFLGSIKLQHVEDAHIFESYYILSLIIRRAFEGNTYLVSYGNFHGGAEIIY